MSVKALHWVGLGLGGTNTMAECWFPIAYVAIYHIQSQKAENKEIGEVQSLANT